MMSETEMRHDELHDPYRKVRFKAAKSHAGELPMKTREEYSKAGIDEVASFSIRVPLLVCGYLYVLCAHMAGRVLDTTTSLVSHSVQWMHAVDHNASHVIILDVPEDWELPPGMCTGEPTALEPDDPVNLQSSSSGIIGVECGGFQTEDARRLFQELDEQSDPERGPQEGLIWRARGKCGVSFCLYSD